MPPISFQGKPGIFGQLVVLQGLSAADKKKMAEALQHLEAPRVALGSVK